MEGEKGGSHRLVAVMEKTRSLPTDFMDLEVIGWPNKILDRTRAGRVSFQFGRHLP